MAPAVLLEYTKVKELKKRKSSSDLSFTMIGNPQNSATFAPDYRHAETMAESEGFGSSCRVDSEDSAAPKRKCLRLNTNNCGDFNVPLQVISLSKMSRLERKELAMKLRAELEQTQNLQKTISMRAVPCISGAAVSSSSNGHRMKPDTIGQNATQLLKRGITGRFESSKRAQPRPSISSSVAMLMKPCAQLLNHLMTHKYGWVFNKPVDIVKLNIPDYFSVIKHPMDLGTIKDRINSGFYSSPYPFAADVRLTFTNALTYNPPKNDVHIMADTLSKLFEQRWKHIEIKLAAAGSHVKRDSEATKVEPQSKKRKVPPVSHNMLMTERVKPKMTMEEKENLNRRLESIIMDPPAHIIEFLRRHSGNANQASEEDEMEMEIDIGCLSDDVLFELGKLLDAHLREKQSRKQEKAEPCEMEILNESGLSNSSMHPSKGNEPVDEDVDIGGNDPPVSSYPPVEIEKDTAPRSSKCSTSSSSSSDSGSSSSDSDSGSSSGSESNERVASPPKDNAGGDVAVDQEKSDLMNPLDISRSAGNELDRELEQDANKKAVSIETDSCLIEGENAPSERHVSPDKLYRAAILRSRFADTILKAREKTLDQVDKGDPDKMRRDREELERQKREEKARLQAEAKAAEEARRRAEIEAAAEAKRKRELEREAARQALLKMERTVEINENSLNPKDWEMLGTAPMDHLPSSAEEASPDDDNSLDGLGGFNLGGSSNPLEQLGLYMKPDDEEDEEGEPPVLLPASNDVEEGEID